MTANLLRGAFRVWIVLTALWCSYVFIDRADDFRYAYRFYFDHESLIEGAKTYRKDRLRALLVEQAELQKAELDRLAKAKTERESEYGKQLEAAGLPLKPSPPNPQLAQLTELIGRYSTEPTIYPPEPEPLALLLGPPAALALLAVAVWRIGGWVLAGFRSGK